MVRGRERCVQADDHSYESQSNNKSKKQPGPYPILHLPVLFLGFRGRREAATGGVHRGRNPRLWLEGCGLWMGGQWDAGRRGRDGGRRVCWTSLTNQARGPSLNSCTEWTTLDAP